MSTLGGRRGLFELQEDRVDWRDPDLLDAVQGPIAVHHRSLHVVEGVNMLLDECLDLSRVHLRSTLSRAERSHISHVLIVRLQCTPHLELYVLDLAFDLAVYLT